MKRRRLLMTAGIAALLPTSGAAAAADGCEVMMPSSLPAPKQRPLVPEDLVRLRDIGPADAGSRTSPIFTLSPDGRRAAFQLRRAEPDRNRYCLAMAVLDASGGAAEPRIVDSGGEILLRPVDTRGRAGVPTGVVATVTPRWAPDGRWIAFLKRVDGRTQVWRADVDGAGSSQVTRGDADVVDFRVGARGSTIIFATRPGIARAHISREREGLSGFHYDDRFAPTTSNRPFPPLPQPRQAYVVELATGAIRDATTEEAREVGAALPNGVEEPTERAGGTWISDTRLTGGAAAGGLKARLANGDAVVCEAPECIGATDPWRESPGEAVRFFRREGAGLATTAIYEWAPARGTVRQLYRTDDVLADCTPARGALICLREASLQPRRLERLDPVSGRRTLIFDPNPEFARLRLGEVERLHWRNAFGIETVGDLVRPVGFRPGRRYPLIVVQYDTRGFLRGGTGDEYPIQAFANRGYAVLSVRRPMMIGLERGGRTVVEVERLNHSNFADRKSILSAVEEGVRLAIAKGVADPERIGITGLSDGATTAVFALIHSRLFAAAAISSCCLDTTLPARVGPAGAWEFYDIGYPRLIDDGTSFWREISPRLNARKITAPILLQLADDEYLSALESYTALREADAPADMFVFPNEHHIKWQPAHRLAAYLRSLDWFDYWLRGVRSEAQERQAELAGWDALGRQKVSRRPE